MFRFQGAIRARCISLVLVVLFSPVAINSSFASGLSNTTCRKAGEARVTPEGVYGCLRNAKGRLRWKLVQASTTTIPTTTTLPVSKCGRGPNVYSAAFEVDGVVPRLGSAVVDRLGSVYVSGLFSGTIDIEPGPGVRLLTAQQGSIFVLKLDQAGNVSWARQFSNEGLGFDENVPDIAVDPSGNVLLAGAFFRAGDFDPGAGTTILTPRGQRDSWVSKLDSFGNLLWLKQISGTDTVAAKAVSVDLSGQVLVAGSFNRTADFDPGSGTSNLSAQGNPGDSISTSRRGDDVFVMKLTPSGEFEWARTFGANQASDVVSDLIVDQETNIVVAGLAGSSADLDPGDATYLLERPAGGYVLKLNSAGGFTWAKGIVADYAGPTLALDPFGAIHISGSFLGTRDLDPGSSVQAFTSRGVDTYTMKLDGSGSLVWIRVVSGSTLDHQPSIGVDSAGNVFAFGRFLETADFDPGEGVSNLTSRGGSRLDLADLYISRLTSAGSLVWVRQFNAISGQTSTALAVDQLGNSYTVSVIVGLVDMDFGPGACVLGNRSSREVSLLISKFNSSGSNL